MQARPTPRSFLDWTTPPLVHDVDVIGPIELQLDAACTAPDTAFIAVLQDVDEDGNATNITAGYLRAGLAESGRSREQARCACASVRHFRSSTDRPEGDTTGFR